MSRQRDVRLIIREIMDLPEYQDLSYTDIINIVYWAQYGFVHNVISSGDKLDESSFKSVRLPGLGSFVAHPKRVRSKVNYNKEKLNEESSEQLPSEE